MGFIDHVHGVQLQAIGIDRTTFEGGRTGTLTLTLLKPHVVIVHHVGGLPKRRTFVLALALGHSIVVHVGVKVHVR